MKKNIGLALFLVLLFILIIATYKDYGVAWDEKIFFNTGKYFLAQTISFFHIRSNLDLGGFVPTPYHLAGHGVLYDFLIVTSTIFLRSFSFEILHLMKALFSIPIFILAYFIVQKLLDRKMAIFSLFLLLLFPRFYADIFVNAIDIPTTLFFSLNLWYFIYYLKSKPTLAKDLLFGFILATAITHRLLLFYLFPLNFCFILLHLFLEKKLNPSRFLLKQAFIFISLVFFLHLFHPLLFVKPLTGFFELLALAQKYPWNAAVLFDGKMYQAGIAPLPWYYIPKSMLITIPVVTLVLFLIGHVGLIRLMGNQKQNRTNRLMYLYLLLIFYIPLLITFVLKPTLYDSWRHFLFLTIPLIIIALFGLAWLRNLKSKILNSVVFIVVIVGFIFTAREMIDLHPYEYLYYNSLVGGLKGAAGQYETDYWGLGYKEAILWFNKNVNEPNHKYKIWTEGDPLSSSYYFKPNMRLAENAQEADYIITFTRWNFHLYHPGKIIHIVKKEGVPLIYIKQK